jgi:hypothetical protein
MSKPRGRLSKTVERKLAAELFNHTWELLQRKRRTPQEREEMLHSAHASRYHWGRVGGPLNVSIAEWQISRVYSVLRRAEPAMFHARRCLAVSRKARLDPFYIGYAYEALARASAVAGKRRERDRYLREAQRCAERVRARDDRQLLVTDLHGLA